MSKQNILITGSSGYLGENIILKLFKQKKYQITGIDIKPNKKIEGLIRFVNADISNGETLKENLNDIDVICQ
jgi:nucleoside-diphosphate-sugar epimerase